MLISPILGFRPQQALLLAAMWGTLTVAAEVASVELPKIQYTSVSLGLDYANVHESKQPWSIHIARLDRKAKAFDVVTTHGKGRIQGLAGLSQQVAAFPAALGRPLAAVNGDFFLIKPGPY